jgi:hypothetical protein
VEYILNPAAGAVAPAAASQIAATATSSTQAVVRWLDNSSNETGFKIERATSADFTQNLTLVTTTVANATSYTDTGLTAGTTYYYRVRATNSSGDATNSNTATVLMPTIPATPTGLGTTIISPTEVDLSWTDNSNNETFYVVERATNSTFTQNDILLPRARHQRRGPVYQFQYRFRVDPVLPRRPERADRDRRQHHANQSRVDRQRRQ